MPIELATYKHAPSKSLPMRGGPIQCVRNCTKCILKQNYDDDAEAENVIAIKSYDNLVLRKKLWISKYQTIQYHPGQIDVLKHTLKTIDATMTFYVVATTRPEDLEYFQQVLSYENLPRATLKTSEIELELGSSSFVRNCIVPIRMICCVTHEETGDGLLDVNGLRDLLSPVVDKVQRSKSDFNVAIVPVVISKDHNNASIFGFGSLCIQIMQPYPLGDYLENARSANNVSHLVQHLHHDLSRFGPRLPSHMVALLLIYLDRPEGVSRMDLVDYMRWFKKSAMELDLHLAYTGETDKAIDFALIVFEDFVEFDIVDQVYKVKNSKALAHYADVLKPNLAYYGIISRAILMLHNVDPQNSPLSRFTPKKTVKVMEDDVIELSQDMAKHLDHLIPCRRPCIDFATSLEASFDSMKTLGKYFRTQEARVRQNKDLSWLENVDDDDDFFNSKRNDPNFKPWILVTSRPYRLDRLNLFINVVDADLRRILKG